MKSLINAAIRLVLAVVFPLVFMPAGALLRWLADPMQLRKSAASSYLRMLPAAAQASSSEPFDEKAKLASGKA